MNREAVTLFVLLAGLTSLFLWSRWAGLAGIGAIAAWFLSLYLRDAAERRALRRRNCVRLEQGFAAQGLRPEAEFHGQRGYSAIGVAAGGKFICCTSTEGIELFTSDKVLEACARRLPQGSYEIGICVPGRVSGKPYWHTVLVARRNEAERWKLAVASALGDRLKP